ncbi:hypothetical protein ACFVRR_22780 [Gottfriedia sp. NPDC057948]|uniref:hypothetical protein n=1 Tax=Gottfriedia sp. NPDC057948 TaxID=3346287 RepID=UPI0036DC2354
MKKLNHLLIVLFTLSFLFTTSNVFASDTATGEKGVVTNLTATHKDHVVTLNWDANADDTYSVERDGHLIAYDVKGGVFRDDVDVADDVNYTYTVWATGSEEKSTVNIIIEKDTTPPPNVVPTAPLEVNNHYLRLSWSPSTVVPDFRGVVVYQDGLWAGYAPRGTWDTTVDQLETNTSYTFSYCAVDLSGNIVPLAECPQQTLKTGNDITPPSEITNYLLSWQQKNVHVDPVTKKTIADDYIHISWVAPYTSDYVASRLTLPNGEIKTFFGAPNANHLYVYKPPTIYADYHFLIQTIDENGNVSKGTTVYWDNPNPPGPVTNVKITESNGTVNISFKPPVDHDYSFTEITLPSGKNVIVHKGTNSYSYKGSLVVGQSYNFVFRTSDPVQSGKGTHYSKAMPVTIKPKATTVNKYSYTMSSAMIKSLAEGKGTNIKSLSKGAKIYVISTGYGVKHNYVYVKYAGKYVGYLPKASVKF